MFYSVFDEHFVDIKFYNFILLMKFAKIWRMLKLHFAVCKLHYTNIISYWHVFFCHQQYNFVPAKSW